MKSVNIELFLDDIEKEIWRKLWVVSNSSRAKQQSRGLWKKFSFLLYYEQKKMPIITRNLYTGFAPCTVRKDLSCDRKPVQKYFLIILSILSLEISILNPIVNVPPCLSIFLCWIGMPRYVFWNWIFAWSKTAWFWISGKGSLNAFYRVRLIWSQSGSFGQS